MNDGEYCGMQTFDQAIARLYDRGLVERDVALDHASYAPALRVELERADRERDRPVITPA